MKKLILLTFVLIFSTCNHAYAQTTECPSANGCVLITREAAIKAVEDAAARKALESEVKAKDQAIEDHKQLEQKLLVTIAEKSGENTALKQNAVSDRALIQILVQYARPKKIGLNIF